MSVAIKKVSKKTPKKVNHVAIVLDSSGSIKDYGLTNKMVDLFNQAIADLMESSEKFNQETYVTAITFAYSPSFLFKGINIKDVKPLTLRNYVPYGGTAMLDAIGEAISSLQIAPINKKDDTSYLLIGLTDGQENSSQSYTYQSITNLNKQLIKDENWTITFNCPIGSKYLLSKCGLLDGNIREFETTKKGVEETSYTNTNSLQNYYAARSMGAKSLTNFYQVDLAGLKISDVKKKLDKVTDNFKLYEVPKEFDIKSFVESKGYEYKEGSCFYELTKKEKVQPSKEILLMKKNENDIWGGPNARQLIGIPDGQEVKVDPLNVAEYRVFVLSTSTNRKLVRGSKLAVRVS